MRDAYILHAVPLRLGLAAAAGSIVHTSSIAVLFTGAARLSQPVTPLCLRRYPDIPHPARAIERM